MYDQNEFFNRSVMKKAMNEIETKAVYDKPVDMVNNPPHYTQGGIECIDAIRAAVTGKPPYEAWLVGQIIKYVWRYNFKNGVEDLKKAKFYLDRLIDHMEQNLQLFR